MTLMEVLTSVVKDNLKKTEKQAQSIVKKSVYSEDTRLMEAIKNEFEELKQLEKTKKKIFKEANKELKKMGIKNIKVE